MKLAGTLLCLRGMFSRIWFDTCNLQLSAVREAPHACRTAARPAMHRKQHVRQLSSSLPPFDSENMIRTMHGCRMQLDIYTLDLVCVLRQLL